MIKQPEMIPDLRFLDKHINVCNQQVWVPVWEREKEREGRRWREKEREKEKECHEEQIAEHWPAQQHVMGSFHTNTSP